MRITRVYTKTGDAGTTGLAGGQRVPKDDRRIEAYGTVDELNSLVGVAVAALTDPELRAQLEQVQHHLFDVGGDLCVLDEDKRRFGMAPFPDDRTPWLEAILDRAADELPPLEEFVLPGGEAAAGHLHVARAVCRRAERLCVALARGEPVTPSIVPYLNRLSDALFVMARLVNHRAGRGDVLWRKAHRRGDGAAGAAARVGSGGEGAP